MSYSITITGDNQDFIKKAQECMTALDKVGQAAKEQGKTVTTEADNMSDAFSKIKNAAAGVFAGISATSFIKECVNARGEMEKLEVSFQTLLGSKEKADELMAQMVQTAATTPFDMNSVANGARQLLAYGAASEDVNGTLIQLGNIAAGLSQPLNDIVYLYGTTMTQGRLYTQDLNQFTGRGIPMMSELAKIFGVAESEVKDLVQAGKVGFPEVQQVIQNLTQEGGMFYNLMENQSKTIAGQISNLEDQISTMFNDIGAANSELIEGGISFASNLINNWEQVGKVLINVAGAIGLVKGAMVAVQAVQKASKIVEAAGGLKNLCTALFNVKNALNGATVAQYKLNAAAMANVYVAIAAAVVGLATAIYQYVKAADVAGRAMDDFNDNTSKAEGEAAALFQTLRECERGTAEYETALKKLNQEYPDIIQNHTDSKTGLLDIAAAEDAVCAAIKRRIATETLANTRTETMTKMIEEQTEAMGDIREDLFDKLVQQLKWSGKSGEEAQKAAKEVVGKYIQTLKAEAKNINLTDLDLTTDSGQKEAENRTKTAYLNARNTLMQLSTEAGVQAQRVGHVTASVWEDTKAYFDAIADQATDVAKTKQQLSDVTDFDEDGGKGGKGGTPTREEVEEVDALTAAWNKYNDALTEKKKAQKEGNEEAVKQREAEMKAANEEIKAAEKSINTTKAATDEKKRLNEVLETAVIGSAEYKDFEARIKAMDKLLGKDKKTKTKSSEPKAELTEQQKQQKAQEDAEHQARALQIATIKDVTQRKIESIQLEYDKRMQAIKWEREAETNKAKKQGKETLDTSKTMELVNKEAEAEANRVISLNEVNQQLLDATMSYWDRRALIEEQGQAKIDNIRSLQAQGLIDEKGAERRIADVQYQTNEQTSALDVEQAKQDPAFNAWLQTVNTMTLDALKNALGNAEQVLAALEAEGGDDSAIIAERAKITTLKKEIDDKENSPKDTKDIEQKVKAYKKLATRVKQVCDSVDELAESFNGAGSDAMKCMSAIIDFGLNSVDSIVSLTTGTTQAMETTAVTAGNAIKAVEKASVILTIIAAALQLVQKMISIFGDKGNDTSAMQQHYQNVADTLDDILDKQKEALENSNASTVNANAEEAKLTAEKQLEAYRNKAYQRTKHREKHEHSVAYKSRGLIRGNAEELAAITGKQASFFRSITDLTKLSGEELEQIKTKMPTLWADLDEETRQSLDKMIELKDEVKEIEETAAEVQMGFSKDDLKSDFKDALLELDDSTDSFAESFEERIRQSIVSGIVWDAATEEAVDNLYSEMRKTMTDKAMSEEEKKRQVEEIQKQISDIYAQKNAEAKALYEEYNVAGDASSREGEEAGFKGMTQETAEELNGRFTALQGYTHLIQQSVAEILSGNKAALSVMSDLRGIASDLNTLARARNTILSGIQSLLSTINAKGLYLRD